MRTRSSTSKIKVGGYAYQGEDSRHIGRVKSIEHGVAVVQWCRHRTYNSWRGLISQVRVSDLTAVPGPQEIDIRIIA